MKRRNNAARSSRNSRLMDEELAALSRKVLALERLIQDMQRPKDTSG
jgi:hypothetical protein